MVLFSSIRRSCIVAQKSGAIAHLSIGRLKEKRYAEAMAVVAKEEEEEGRLARRALPTRWSAD